MRLYGWHQTGYRDQANVKGVSVTALGMPLEWTTCTDRVELSFKESPVSHPAVRRSIVMEMTLEEAEALHTQLGEAVAELKAAIVKREQQEAV